MPKPRWFRTAAKLNAAPLQHRLTRSMRCVTCGKDFPVDDAQARALYAAGREGLIPCRCPSCRGATPPDRHRP